VATEFDIQGLELDWVAMCWDADLRRRSNRWDYFDFRGTRWSSIHNEKRKVYLENAYRVLLTRARQGMVIFVPTGSDEDSTRQCEFYQGIYEFLLSCGISDLD